MTQADAIREIDTGSPMQRFARGWHCLGLAEEFADGKPHGIEAFGTKLVVSAGLLTMAAGFAIAAGSTLDSAYWGRIVLAMVLMAGGLGLVMGPATEAITGTLRTEQAGAGSAVNDTVREVGGTLGVAVVGSVRSTFVRSTCVSAAR